MSEGKIFVGRKAELEQFKEVLKNPKGQAVLVVGQAGMGKTWLVNKMAEIAENHPELKCGWVRYEITPTDSVDSTMALMMDNAFEAAQVVEGSFDGTTRRLEQWKSLLNVINIGDLVMSLKRDLAKNTREQYLERLRLISKRMPKNGRAIFVIDPEKYMQEKCDQSWAIVVKELPNKIKFIFAQRPEDVLVESETFGALDNVSHIPEERLDILEEESVDELINKRVAGLKYTVTEVREVLSRYKGHPYSLQGSLDLLKAGSKLDKLPRDPMGIAAAQWKELSKRGKEAIRLFKASAILEVGVPNEVVESVSELDTDTLQSVLSDNYLSGLLREEGEGKRIYHAILADYIVEQIGEAEKKEYHSQAVEVYRGKLEKAKKEQIQPDALAVVRLPEHVLIAEGEYSFVVSFVTECTEALFILGLLDVAMNFSERGLKICGRHSIMSCPILTNIGLIHIQKGDWEKAEFILHNSLEIIKEKEWDEGRSTVYTNLGVLYRKQGNLEMAEDMHRKSIAISQKIGMEEKGGDYSGLGSVYQMRGELKKAERMYLKALAIEKKFGLIGKVAIDLGNLGGNYALQGNLKKAEEMLLEALEIDQRMGRVEGIANHLGNLASVYSRRGNFEKAEEFRRKALQIDESLGRQAEVSVHYGNLGTIYFLKKDLDKAEKMYLKSLEISEFSGMLETTANQYSNLGDIYYKRGDNDKARQYWEKAVELYKRIGIPHMVETVQGLIEGIEN